MKEKVTHFLRATTIASAITIAGSAGFDKDVPNKELAVNFGKETSPPIVRNINDFRNETSIGIYALSFNEKPFLPPFLRKIEEALITETPTPIQNPEEMPEPDRTECYDIKGTEYNSEKEREWYLENCKSVNINPKKNSGFFATHYGESFNGQGLGCGTGYYSSENTRILAVPPARDKEWPCGTVLKITNPASGESIEVERHDFCPGCGPNTIDLSESGLDTLCGKKDCSSVSGLLIEVIERP